MQIKINHGIDKILVKDISDFVAYSKMFQKLLIIKN